MPDWIMLPMKMKNNMSILDLQKKYHTLPALDLNILIAEAITQPKEFIYTHSEYSLSLIQNLRFCWLTYLYKKGYSIAAIVGHKEFYGLNFFVNKNVLIPRPETELMVENAIEEIKKTDKKITLIDVGTGSGCIPIAIINSLTHKNINTFATDVSRSALRAAKKNARIHNVNINFFHGHLLEPVIKTLNLKPSLPNSIIITANLPYGWSAWKNNGSVASRSLKREPAIALFTGEKGLALYRQLLEQMKQLNKPFIAFFEFDPRQTEMLTKLILSILPNAKIEIKKDLAGLDRLVKLVN